MSWTNDVIIEFIQLYQRESILWDPKHANYKVRMEISSAWARIQSALSVSFSVLDLKKKKESLMTTFRLQCSKKRNSQYKSTWFAYPYLESFLGTRYECDSTVDSKNELNTVDRPTKDGIETERGITKKFASETDKLSDCSSKSEFDDSVPISKDSNESTRELDEYDLFGQLLVKKLRKLDDHHRDIAMHEIDNLLFRTKMQSKNAGHFVSLPNSSNYNSNSTAQHNSWSSNSNLKTPIFIVTQAEGVMNYEEYHEQKNQQSPS